MAIPTIFKHGVEITKPWSTEMYAFNDNLKAQYRTKIKELIEGLETEDQCQFVAKIVNPYGYGFGFSVDDMKADMLKNIEMAESYWYKEMITAMLAEDLIDPVYINDEKANLIGFESGAEIKELRKKYSA